VGTFTDEKDEKRVEKGPYYDEGEVKRVDTPLKPEISFEDWSKVDIRVGTVVKAEPNKKSKKPCYKIWVDFGPGVGERQTSAQVTELFSMKEYHGGENTQDERSKSLAKPYPNQYDPEGKEYLVGRKVLGVLNLGSRRIGGFNSEFLCTGGADADGMINLATVSPGVPNGEWLCHDKSEINRADQPLKPQVQFEDWSKVDLRFGTVVQAERNEKSNKPSYKIWVDFGPGVGQKQTSVQVTELYNTEFPRGKKTQDERSKSQAPPYPDQYDGEGREYLVGRKVLGVLNLGRVDSEFLCTGSADANGMMNLATVSPGVPDGEWLC